ncbi:short-chain dehydrogenase/reductase family oxidoreductase, partial [Metarhizium majus ARSEF 297]
MAEQKNTVYVITGGNRGIGLGLVKSFLARPATTVIASARNTEAAASLKAEDISFGAGSQLHVAILDLSSALPPAKVLEAFEAATAGTVDHIDVLINNAGSCPPMSAATETSAEDLRGAFETNTIAPLMVFQGLWPLLQKTQMAAPKVIMVSSTVGGIGCQEPLPGGAYGASKAALNWLTRAIHLQNEASGLVAVALHPGWVQTRLGDFAAKEWSYAAGPPTTLDESVEGILKVVDGASRETVGGKFVLYDGQIWPW